MAAVLVVEDDKLSQKLLARILGNAGHDALVASNAEEAWEQLRRHVLVDLLILDNQLGRDWGWQFLRELRHDPVFGRLPTIVYTAHTERESIVRYVELGVQSMHVKPYRGEVVLEELKKASRLPWNAQFFEETERVCERLKITPGDYCGLLSAAVPLLEAQLGEVRRRIASKNDPALRATLTQMKQRSASVGVLVLGTIVTAVTAALDADDLSLAVARLRTIEPLFDIMRQRALEAVSLGDMARRSGQVRVGTAAEAPDVFTVDAPASIPAAFARQVGAKPIWQLGGYLERLYHAQLISVEQLDETGARLLKEPVFAAFFAAVAIVRRTPELSVDQVVQLIAETDGLTATFQRILEHLQIRPEGLTKDARLRAVIEKQGVAKVVALVAAARIARASRPASPLDLEPMFCQTLGVMLFTLELGRMLKLSSPHLLAAAGVVHNIGQWVFALGEPGLYALALGLGQSGRMTPMEAEGAIFATTHEEAGRRLLASVGETLLLQDAAALHHDPLRVQTEAHVVTVVVVHLASLLTQAAFTPEKTHALELREALKTDSNPVWVLLKARGVELPFAAPELVDAMAGVAETTAWVARELTRG